MKIKKHIHKVFPKIIAIQMLILACIFPACARHTKPNTMLSFHAGMGLEQAVSKAMKDLNDPDMHPEFDAYFTHLIKIAQDNPDIKNKQIFSEFLLFANRNGILTKHIAQDYYNRYFNITFMSLPDNYNVSSSCYDKTKIMSDMEAELLQKEQGLLKACRDKSNYYLAYDHYNTLRVVYDATCLACAGRK